MKVSGDDHTLVNDKCPVCWMKVGKDHDYDCWLAAKIEKDGPPKKTNPDAKDSEWLKEKKEKYVKSRKPTTKATSSSTPSTPKVKLGGVGNFVDTVSQVCRGRYGKCKIRCTPADTDGFDGHLRDIPGKAIVVDGSMGFDVDIADEKFHVIVVTEGRVIQSIDEYHGADRDLVELYNLTKE